MNITAKLVLLGVFVIFQCFGAYGADDDVTTPIAVPLPTNNEPILPTAGYPVQQVTKGIHYVGQIFYIQRLDAIIYPDRKVNGSFNFLTPNGSKSSYYIKEIKDELFTLIIPLLRDKQYLIGSDLNFRTMYMNGNRYTISEPLITFNHTDYIMHAAKCDFKGVMWLLITGNKKEIKNSAFLYKVVKRVPTLMLELNNGPRDIRFNQKENYMYILHSKGITRYEYNQTAGLIGNSTEVFDVSEQPALANHTIRSLILDREEPANMFITAAGKEGYLLKVPEDSGKITSITPVPSKDLTFIGVGGFDYKYILIGSRRTCVKGVAQGSIYGVTGINAQGTASRPMFWY